MEKSTGLRRTRADKVFDFCNVVLCGILLLITFYPLYFTVIASLSDPYSVARGEVFVIPKGFTLEAYKNTFENGKIWIGYRNTIFYTIAGTLFNLALTLPTAYVLSKKFLPGRKGFSIYFLVPMYFGGGLIPSYLLVKNLGLLDTLVTIVILGGLSIYNMIVCRVFFQNSIPQELYESSKVDGANEFTNFFQIALPLSTPIIAVMALYYGVSRWNDYYTALIYVNNSNYQPLQMVLREILIQNQSALLASENVASMDAEAMELEMRRAYMAEAMKYALIFIASAPLLVVYPFVQKYFVKGMMIGALKG